jgi:hypothetical protein
MLAAKEKPVFTVTNNAVRDFETYSDSEQKVKTMDGVKKFVRPQLRRFRNTTRSSVLLYHLLLSIQHVPIDTLDILDSWPSDAVPNGGAQKLNRFSLK